jgi:hypothetical protein
VDDAGFAGELSVVALLALLTISFTFIGLSRFLNWLARRTSEEKVEPAEVEILVDAKRSKRAQIAIAAVTSYLEAEKASKIRGSRGSMDAKAKSTTQEGEN